MEYRINTPIRKVGGSFYALIPEGIVKQLEITKDTKTITAIFEKTALVLKEMCNTFKKDHTILFIRFKDKELIGHIREVDEENITFYDAETDKCYVIEIEEITQMEPTKPDIKLNKPDLKDNIKSPKDKRK